MAMAQAAAASTSNCSAGTQTARLFGMHEISFTLTALSTNPYDRVVTVIFDPPNLGASGNLEVRAFYDGTTGDQETWRARVYVNRVGTWSWTSSTGTTNSFTAEEVTTSKLHGMLRVSSVVSTTTSLRVPNGDLTEAWATQVGTPKRWYTDDGHTFLPLADTAYMLFFETPVITSTNHLPSLCPLARMGDSASTFISQYAEAVKTRGINTLRVMAFGAFVWETMSTTVTAANVECGADLSLYWSTTRQAEDQDLYDSAPRFSNLAGPTVGYYPNLKSFQATDRKLKQLLNDYPELYIQMILVPDGSTAAGGLTTTHKTYRTQMWETMAARWAAFPTVFWTIANDLADTTPEALPLGKEISCYFADNRDQTTCNALVYPANFTDYNPWRQNRPLSMGHLRNQRDAFAPATPAAPPQAPWHNYITAYTGADLSAQHLDGTVSVPWDSDCPRC